ncbi:hypothetical protein PLESTB_001090600 [Pleodorina starrii]|uniref:Uncharacterized protein n=1 Tax=Pleodorina starrii TaxID=330485 RepID=A0A9W6BQ24_9CHLO|nr:hypothetical protein PLESTB_001090600 [Pleodorina starrii]
MGVQTESIQCSSVPSCSGALMQLAGLWAQQVLLTELASRDLPSALLRCRVPASRAVHRLVDIDASPGGRGGGAVRGVFEARVCAVCKPMGLLGGGEAGGPPLGAQPWPLSQYVPLAGRPEPGPVLDSPYLADGAMMRQPARRAKLRKRVGSAGGL